MNRRYLVAGTFLVMAACATSGSVSPEHGANDGDEVEVADTSEILTVADVRRQSEVTCRVEKRTGSNRASRVCRSRSQTAKSAVEAKETFEILRKSQTNNR